MKSNDLKNSEEAFCAFETELQKTLEDVQKVIPSSDPSEKTSGKAGNLNDLKTSLEKLLTFVDKSSPKNCKVIMSEIISQEWSEEINRRIMELKNSLDVYDFKKAENQLKTIISELSNV